MDDIKEESEEKPHLLKRVMKAFPGTDKVSEDDLESIAFYIDDEFESLDLEVEEITSGLLYEIKREEERCTTVEGAEILRLADECLLNISQIVYPFAVICWKHINEEKKTISYFFLTGNKVIGDYSWGQEFVAGNLHRYNYSMILPILQLKEKIQDWVKRRGAGTE